MQTFLKRIGVVLLALLLVIPAFGASASSSPERISLSNATVKVSSKHVYRAHGFTIPVTVKLNGKTLTEGVDYVVGGNEMNREPGTYKVSIAVVGIGMYKGSVIKNVKFTVTKMDQELIVSPATFTVKASEVKTSNKSLHLVIENCKGKLKISGPSGWRLSVNNCIVVPKGTKAGTYYVRVYASATKHYAQSDAWTIKVVVK